MGEIFEQGRSVQGNEPLKGKRDLQPRARWCSSKCSRNWAHCHILKSPIARLALEDELLCKAILRARPSSCIDPVCE